MKNWKKQLGKIGTGAIAIGSTALATAGPLADAALAETTAMKDEVVSFSPGVLLVVGSVVAVGVIIMLLKKA